MTTVLDCIERIPSKLIAIQEQRSKRFDKLHTYLACRDIDKVIFIASGTSYNSAFTTRMFFEQCQIPVQFQYPNIFVQYTNLYDEHALYVVISQGGSTKTVYEALELVKKKGYANCSITESLASPIAQHADVALEMGSDDEEFMYRTIGYSTTVATCYMLAMSIAQLQKKVKEEDICMYMDDYSKMIDHLETIKHDTLTWYEQHKFSLMHKEHMMFTATSDLWPVAQEADIKFMEMIPALTRSFELEEFIHGPQNAFDASSAYFILTKEGSDSEKTKAIANFLKQEIGFTCLVGDITMDTRDLSLHAVSKYFAPLEYITVMQILAYKLADDHGRDLHRGVNAQIKKYITKTL